MEKTAFPFLDLIFLSSISFPLAIYVFKHNIVVSPVDGLHPPVLPLVWVDIERHSTSVARVATLFWMSEHRKALFEYFKHLSILDGAAITVLLALAAHPRIRIAQSDLKIALILLLSSLAASFVILTICVFAKNDGELGQITLATMVICMLLGLGGFGFGVFLVLGAIAIN